MVEVRVRQKSRIDRYTRLLRHMLNDRLLVVAIALALLGLAIFQLSSLSGRNQLQRIPTGGGTFLLANDKNSTVQFSAIHGETPHLVFSIKNGTEFSYVIYQYNNVQGPYGSEYFQFPVSSGIANSTDPNIYLPITYVDATYFINMTAVGNTHPIVSITAYSEFEMYQPFQFPAEIAGLLIMLTGIIMVAARLSVIFSPV